MEGNSSDTTINNTADHSVSNVNIFVYGTLRKHLTNNYRLAKGKYVGIYKTINSYYMIGLNSKSYPYVTAKAIHHSLK